MTTKEERELKKAERKKRREERELKKAERLKKKEEKLKKKEARRLKKEAKLKKIEEKKKLKSMKEEEKMMKYQLRMLHKERKVRSSELTYDFSNLSMSHLKKLKDMVGDSKDISAGMINEMLVEAGIGHAKFLEYQKYIYHLIRENRKEVK